MGKNKNCCFLSNFSSLLLGIMFMWGCASMRNPEGGPKDTSPPKILKMIPENMSTNFNAKKIVIEFDEYIKLNNVYKEFSISPELEKEPELKVKLKRLEISLTDSLEKNTTYTLNFGKSIVDLNESNELKNFNYVFATGNQLDSLSISGKVINELKGQAEIESTVFVYPLEKDSLFGKKRPSIYTLSDSSGNFKLKNLKKGPYKIYALKEKSGGDRIYQQQNDEIAFLSDTLYLEKNIDSVVLKIFKEKAKDFRVTDSKLNNDGSIFASFNQQLKKPELKIVGADKLDQGKYVQFSKQKDSVRMWLSDMSWDSIKVVILDQQKIIDSMKFSRPKKESYTRVISVSDNLESQLLNPFKNLELYFNFPINSIDESKILLLEDSIPRKFTLEKDSSNFLNYRIKYNWKAKEQYILELKENAVSSIFDIKNKEIRKNFSVDEAANYGTLILTVEPPDTSATYILQLVNKDKNPISSYPIRKKEKIKLANFKQGVYFARIVYDLNHNGNWDTGDISKKLQAEPIWYEPKELSIRANWDREETIKIPKK